MDHYRWQTHPQQVEPVKRREMRTSPKGREWLNCRLRNDEVVFALLRATNKNKPTDQPTSLHFTLYKLRQQQQPLLVRIGEIGLSYEGNHWTGAAAFRQFFFLFFGAAFFLFISKYEYLKEKNVFIRSVVCFFLSWCLKW